MRFVAFLVCVCALGEKLPTPTAFNSRHSLPSNGLVGLYWVNEGSGSVLHDSSPRVPGRCGDMTITGSPVWNPAHSLPWQTYASGIKFPTTSDYATIPAACTNNIYSAVFVMQPAADYGSDSDDYAPLLGGNNNGMNGSLLLKAGTFAPMIWNGSLPTVVDLGIWGDGAEPLGSGRCIGTNRVVTYVTGTGGTDHVYCDGVEAMYRSCCLGSHTQIGSNVTTRWIAKDQGFTNPMTRTISAIAFYSRAVSQNEVVQITRAIRKVFVARSKSPTIIVASGDSITDTCGGADGFTSCSQNVGKNYDVLTADANASQLTFAIAGNNGNTNTVTSSGGEGGWLMIDSELMHVVGTTSTSFTVAARGAKGTTAAAHATNAAVLYGWPIQLRAMLTSPVLIVNGAVQGRGSDNMYQRLAFGYTTQNYPGTNKSPGIDLVADVFRPRIIDVSSECINSNLVNGPSDAETWMGKYIKSRAYIGIEAIAMSCTAFDRGDSIEAARQAYNLWLKSNWKALGAVDYIDLDADPLLNPGRTNVAPPVWQGDTMHIASYGQFLIAQHVAAMLNTHGIY